MRAISDLSYPHALVIEDELAMAEGFELFLRQEGYQTERASNGLRALELFQTSKPDIVLLDLGLPKLDGLEVLKNIRRESDVPVIILTARREEVDELLGLGLGADAYLTKPVSGRKLVAHVKTVLRRSQSMIQETLIRLGRLKIDTYAMQVSIDDKAISLTPTEFRLLQYLANTPERAIARQELYEAAMLESDAYERAVDVYIMRLRKKLAEAGLCDSIKTVRGVGYRLIIS